MPACTAETHAALATIGQELAHFRTHAAILRQIDPRLRKVGEVHETWHMALTDAFPRGLTMLEALGYTMVLTWVAQPEDLVIPTNRPLIAEQREIWRVRMPTEEAAREVPAATALELARALLHIRRIVWPSQPWRLRDWIAEHLERQARLLEAEIRGPTPTITVTPVVAASDIGRDWRA